MTDDRERRLREIEARHAASTPGEWFYNSYSIIDSTYFVELEESEPEDVVEFNYVASVPPSYGDTATGARAANAEFIAHAHQDVPFLLAEIERLTLERNGYRSGARMCMDALLAKQR